MRTKTVADYVEAKALRNDGMDIVVFRSGTERMEALKYDAPSATPDPAAILAELVTLRIIGDGGLDEGGGSSAA
jgi:hypothetical protein